MGIATVGTATEFGNFQEVEKTTLVSGGGELDGRGVGGEEGEREEAETAHRLIVSSSGLIYFAA